MPAAYREQREKIAAKSASVGVLGLGYVGLPLAMELARAGFRVTGIDIDASKVRDIRAGKSYIADVSSEELAALVQSGRLSATENYEALASCDVVDICVPTPLRKTKDPDLSFILSAVEQIQRFLHPGMLVILESTTYPGTTEELVLPRLAESGLRVGEQFFLCFSPERVDPGNASYHTHNIPKVVGGVTRRCAELGVLFYQQAIETVVPVSSTKVAEMVKLLENTYRSINIGLANEMAMLCDRMGIDVWEVIDAAATKPFGFMPFYPGPGLGGHCIPVDPFYLSWKARMDGTTAYFIELAGRVNSSMPQFVVQKIQSALNQRTLTVNGARIHLLGVAYKRDVADTRESPALDVMILLDRLGARLSYSDPHVPRISLDGCTCEAAPVFPACRDAACVVLLTDHTAFDYAAIAQQSPLIVDSRNAFRDFPSPHIIKL
ncbi:MAG: nucleotide sugar dehydrogenase [Acidobacteria bacterium]|nr:nucleotide sugar dehydrogenase [Acidobacteriota bacterium]